MTLHDRLEALAWLACIGVTSMACSKPAVPTEAPTVPATSAAPTDGDDHARADAAASDADGALAPATVTAEWSRTWTIAPGGMAEINLELEAGDTMAATFSTDGAPLQWNVHSHERGAALVHARGEDASGELRHDVHEAGMYSFLWWSEQQAPVRLTVVLTHGAAKIHSTHPAE